MSPVPDHPTEKENTAPPRRDASAEPNFDQVLKPITEFAGRPDFPECARGEFVDIGGYTGVVVEITSQSIKVKSPEQMTRSFNFHVLRRLYGPRQHPEPEPVSTAPAAAPVSPKFEPERPRTPAQREVIAEPNFARTPKPITDLAGRGDFPKCALGEFVEIAGFNGVIIEIAHDAVKVKSPHGIIRSYGVSTLRKLYGR